jgi:hypothetical protein
MKRAASPWREKGTKQRMEKNGILESFSKYFAEKPYTGIRKHALKFF